MSRISEENLAAVYRVAAERFGDLPAFATKIKGDTYDFLSYRQLYERGLALATALIELGLRPREHVGLLADNRAEWIVCDYGILMAGCADVPRGTDVTEGEIAYILNHADTRFVFLEDEDMLEKFENARRELPGVEKVILMSAREPLPRGVLTLNDLVTQGEKLRAAGDRRAEERVAAIRPEDLFTLIYTSGTTGTPKGVQLTHANMASQIRNLPFDLTPGDRMLSILPIWHSYERIFEMVSISMGACTYYTNLRHIGEDLKIVRPTLMASAPRLWESLYQKIMAKVEKAPPLRRALFHAARTSTSHVKRAERFFVGQQLDTSGRSPGENLSLGLAHLVRWIVFQIPHRLLDRIVLAKLREAVGCGDFRGTISGGGALQPHVDEFFNFIGIPVLEGYGLTETSPVLAVRTWSNLVIGTVGSPYPGTEIRIVDLQTGETLYPDRSRRDGGRGRRGEIHARGPQIMQGYYKNPGETSRVLRDGWFNTGDIGMITFNNCVKILGRSKDTIVLLNGENVEPVPIEARLTQSPLIDHCMVVGQDQKFLGALIVPAVDGFRAAGIQAANVQELAASAAARALLEAELKQIISPANGFKAFERIADFRFLPKPFENGIELTGTFKLKRHVITETYSALLAEMYPAA
ncbi:MAG: AMP-dependent synthetase/ligase [Terrimicrobiaceae bacterium]